MDSFRRSGVWGLLALCVLSVCVRGADLPEEKAKWRHFKSPNFELYTRAKDSASRDLLWNMELLRALFVNEAKLTEREKTDVTVFCFGTEKAFKSFVPENLRNGEYAAFHMPYPDRARVILSDAIDDAQPTIFHEYIHHLATAIQQRQPLWLSEGIADLYSSIVVDGRNVEFGRPVEGRLYELKGAKLIPLAQLFMIRHGSAKMNNARHVGLVYAESWALMHFWTFGRNGLPKGSVDAFTHFCTQNPDADAESVRAAFEAAFKINYAEMEARLRSYVSQGAYTWGRRDIPKIADAATYARREVLPEEMHLRLSELAVVAVDSGLGRFNLIAATQADTADPRPYELLGARAFADNDMAGAMDYWTKAMAKGSVAPAVEREMLRVEIKDWVEQFDPDKLFPEERLAELRGMALRSITRDPEQTVGYEALAWIEAYAGRPDANNLKLVQGRLPKLQFRNHAMLALALAYARFPTSDIAKENVRALLETLRTNGSNEWTQWCVENLSARLEHRRPDFSKIAKPAPALIAK